MTAVEFAQNAWKFKIEIHFSRHPMDLTKAKYNLQKVTFHDDVIIWLRVRITRLLCGVCIDYQWFPSQRVSDTVLCCLLCCYTEETVQQKVRMPEIKAPYHSVRGLHWSLVEFPHIEMMMESFDVSVLFAVISCWTNTPQDICDRGMSDIKYDSITLSGP